MKNIISKSSACFVLLVLVISAPIIITGCGESDSAQTESQVTQKPNVSARERFALNDINGNIRKWSEFAGKPMIINFWATWCGPCYQELPTLKKLYEKYHSKGLEIIAISTDQQKTIKNVVPYVQKMEIPWVVVYADANSVREFRLGRSIPMTVFIDAEGNETGRITGAQPESIFEAEIAKLF